MYPLPKIAEKEKVKAIYKIMKYIDQGLGEEGVTVDQIYLVKSDFISESMINLLNYKDAKRRYRFVEKMDYVKSLCGSESKWLVIDVNKWIEKGDSNIEFFGEAFVYDLRFISTSIEFGFKRKGNLFLFNNRTGQLVFGMHDPFGNYFEEE